MATTSTSSSERFSPPPPKDKGDTPASSTNGSQSTKSVQHVRKEQTDYDKMFVEMEKKIEQLEKKIAIHDKLLQTMQENDDAFDEEDVAKVQTVVYRTGMELEKLQEEYNKRKHCYQNTTVAMKGKLDKRQHILEEFDRNHRILSDNPELSDFFVNKQVGLKKIWIEACNQLLH
jgi:hypothetical protein